MATDDELIRLLTEIRDNQQKQILMPTWDEVKRNPSFALDD